MSRIVELVGLEVCRKGNVKRKEFQLYWNYLNRLKILEKRGII